MDLLRKRLFISAAVLALLGAQFAHEAEAETNPSLSFSGVPGLIDMPSGETLEDGTFSVSVAGFGPIARSTISFQITPWLQGSFRIQNIRDWNHDGYNTYNDRSFDLRFRLLQESEYLPAVSLGLQDFAGTGLFSAEYIAATKTFGDRLKITGGVGWGRLGSYSSFGSPFGDRPDIDFGKGGKPNPNTWFKGPAATFAGIEYKVNESWTIKAEYSSDIYAIEDGERGTFERESPFNFGVEYQRGPNWRMGLYSLYGNEIGLGFHLVLDPKNRPTTGMLGDAPVAVKIRPSRGSDPESYDGEWVTQPDASALLRKNLTKRLKPDGLIIEDFAYTATTVQIRVRNTRIDAGPQVVGRVARALSHVMPASVEVFEIVPVVRGIGASKITMRRSDLETLEHAPQNDALLRERVQVTDAGPAPAYGSGPDEDLYPRLTWRILPAYRVSEPLRGDVGLRFSASYELRPGIVLSGQVYQKFADNLDTLNRLPEPSTLPPVRRDINKYNLDSGTAVERLTIGWYSHPIENIYTRLTFGYLERMHAGISGEVLWKPANSRLALGVEVNYTTQRDTDGGFGFGYMRSDGPSDPEYRYEHTIATGYISAYYDFGNGFLGQLDVGRYLAGDVGATVSLDREFGNGWKVGAFATFTTASEEEFGEGSFDKGIRITVPMNWLLGQPTRQELSTTIRPLQRDGGARVDVDGRLYDTIRDYHTDRLDDQWGRVWR